MSIIIKCMKMEQKPKIFSLNNCMPSPTARLSSLSMKRDLSLGGTKVKKVYRPNVNVIRNKTKSAITINNKLPQHQHNKRNLKALIARTNHQRYVQSNSVFSEGSGELKKPKLQSDRYLNNGERDQSYVAMPKVIQRNWEVNAQEENSVINELVGDGDDDSSSENERDYGPILLPLKDNQVGFLKTFQVKKEEPDVEIKEEIPKPNFVNNHKITPDNCNSDVPWSFQNNKLHQEKARPTISLFQMPDCLPGKGFVADSEKVTDFNLGQMMEGKIGKILIRKSGKIDVQIGNMSYVLDSFETNPCKEDVMCISNNPSAPSMINMGNIDERYVLTPSWKNLFDLNILKKKE